MSTDFFDRLGRPSLVMNGLDTTLEAGIQQAQSLYPHREFCMVSEWLWVDFKGSTLMVEGLALQGVTPSILVAANVLHDSQDRFRAGRGVRTSFLVRYEGLGYFLTQNTVYVMLGPGRRIQLPYRSEFLI
ncbi:DUF6957 family protein [Pseudomonas inefficax]|uniref:DUF6957 family protein n=1 Tax=Pseudomonas inefficax TaxID=2078786 RepID=UPI00404689DD